MERLEVRSRGEGRDITFVPIPDLGSLLSSCLRFLSYGSIASCPAISGRGRIALSGSIVMNNLIPEELLATTIELVCVCFAVFSTFVAYLLVPRG